MQTAFRSEQRFTQAEFWDWLQELPADDINRYELIDGHIVMSPPAVFRHSDLAARLVVVLWQHVVPRGLGKVLESSAGYEFPSGHTLGPDVSFISAARLAAAPELDPIRFCSVAPDLVVEVLSPTTAQRDRTEKKDIYARNGVDEYLLVDADRREVTVFRRDGGSFAAGEIVRSGRVESRVLLGIDLSIEELFADLE